MRGTTEDGHVVNIARLGGPISQIDLDHLSYRHLSDFRQAADRLRSGEAVGKIVLTMPGA